jgi:hypothetical protein
MKRLLLAFLLLVVSLLVGCGGSSGGSTPPVTVTLQSIAITPSSPSITAGSTQQFKATGSYSDGSTKDLTSAANWLSATQSVATINVSGLATAVAAGTTSISASSAGITGTTPLTVTVVPLVSIAVTPATATIAPNSQQQFTATGTYADASTKNITSSVTWSASAGASINPAGLAIGTTPGATSTITATLGTISGTATLTVTNPLVSIAVTAPTLSIAKSTSVQFTAIGTYADASTSVLTSTASWASSAPLVASISNSQGTNGLATGLAAGATSITAMSGSITSPQVTLTVTSAFLVSIAVTPANPAIVYQTQQQFTATGTFNDSTTQDITQTATWSSLDTTKIIITPTGLATGVGNTTSPVTISAVQSSITGSMTATVIPPVVTSILITPGTTSLAVGTSRQYTAIATLANGGTLNVTTVSGVNWTSSAPTIAAVGATTGLVKASAINFGPVTITVSYNGVSQSLNLSVNNVTVNSITVTPATPSIPIGVQQRFNATAAFSDGTTQDISQDATWTSSAVSVATISASGAATRVSVGSTTITAAFSGSAGTALLTVNIATLSSIAVTPPSTVLPVGKTITFQAVGTYSDGSTYFLTTIATWTSSNPSVVKLVSPGIFTTLTPGPIVTITASYQSQSNSSATVIVTQFPLTSIVVTPLTAKIPVDVTTQFQAIGTFSDGSHQSLTNYATWASNPSSVATIRNGVSAQQGIATGVTPGTASVTAVFAGIVSPASTLTVSNATIVSITVTPKPASGKTGTQVQFKAVGTFDDNSTIDLTNQVTWTSSMVTVATITTQGNASIAGTSGQTTAIAATFTQNGFTKFDTSTLTVQ